MTQLFDDLPRLCSIHKLNYSNQELVHPNAKRYFAHDTFLIEPKKKDTVTPNSEVIPASIAQNLREYNVPFYQIKNYAIPSGGFIMLQFPYDRADLQSGQNDRTRHDMQVVLKEESHALYIFRNISIAKTDD